MNEKVATFFGNLGKDIKRNVFTKWIGFAIGLIAVILTVVQTAIYGGLGEKYFSSAVMVFSILAIVSFLVLSVFKQTSSLAPLALFIFELLTLLSFAGSIFEIQAFVDEISTLFFDGFAMDKFIAQPYGICAVFFIINTVLSVVAMYVPQNSDWLYNRMTAGKNMVTE